MSRLTDRSQEFRIFHAVLTSQYNDYTVLYELAGG